MNIKEIKENILNALDDNPQFKCKRCKKKDKLSAHHINPKFPNVNHRPNLIQVCKSCHEQGR